ncbi:MAG: signal peptidase I [Treponema sp.]
MFRFDSEKRKRGEIFTIIIIVFFLYWFITSYFLCSFVITQDSMIPEFTVGSRIFSTPIYRISSLKRGSLVFVENKEKRHNILQVSINAIVNFFTFQLYTPFNKQNDTSTKYLLRRVVGLPGDTIYMKDFILYIKQKGEQHFLTEFEVSECDYNINTEGLVENWKEDLPLSGSMEEMTLGDGQYFLLSDNRLHSFDSRLMGKVEAKTKIKQRVICKYWPINKMKLF